MRRAGRRAVALVVSLALVVPAAGCWRDRWPLPGPRPWPSGVAPSWQWQLSGELDADVDAEVFVLDPFTTTIEETGRLRGRDRRLICYVRAGSYERSRPDAARFPERLLGGAVAADGRRWLDVRQWEVLRPILADRFRLCRGKGFDSVLVADVDGYARSPGFPLGFDDQLLFNRRLAELARSLDLSPGLGNDLPQVAALAPDFDFALNEECVRLRQCERLLPFADAGKPVFHVEYEGTTETFCATSLGYGFSSIRKERALGAWRAPCPA
ncbi:endo alpha-1,4 polygalactosaminidase [Micromonospora sp. NPDC049559]|uniref:endo alpha-1,4 polygalactosaminidase n=1 Tax=Micromonospora sp. NPDC049559 TaxID=3155923 RepID=UPI0034173A1E